MTQAPPQPSTLPVQLERIPAALKGLPRWVGWRWTFNPNKPGGHHQGWDKPLLNSYTGRLAKSDDPETWSSYERAVSFMERESLDGIGFNLLGLDDMVAHDLDDCRDPETGEISPQAMNIVRLVGGYWEITPSGTGIRGICNGKKLGARVEASKGGPVDGAQYDGSKGRYVTLTGHTLPESTEDVTDAHPGGIEAAYALMFPPQQERRAAPAPTPHFVDMDDATLLERARTAANGDKFARLWVGNTTGYQSESEGDEALCCILAFWTGGDIAQIDRLFRQSSLYREKWERGDYRGRTLRRALELTTEFYQPGKASPNSTYPDPVPPADAVAQDVDVHQLIADAAVWKPVSLEQLLDDVVAFFLRYVVMTVGEADATALWVAHAHPFAAWETTPYLAVRSAEKRSGKTRLLEVAELLVPKPLMTENISVAALVHSVAQGATLLLDEVDSIFVRGRPSETQEALRGILDSGHRAGGSYVRMVGQGANMSPRSFNTFGPKMLAGIGRLPGTLDDRSIIVDLKRKTPSERVARFRYRDARAHATPIREGLARWAATAIEKLSETRPDIPDELDDRAADGWEPLLAIAGMAGGGWPQRARDAALELSAGEARQDDSTGVRLLEDIRQAFAAAKADKLFTADLLVYLNAIEDSPWAGFGAKGMTGSYLSRQLKPYSIAPKQVRINQSSLKGYEREWFIDVWTRYCPPSPETSETSETSNLGPIGEPSETSTPFGSIVSPGRQIGLSYDVSPVSAASGIQGDPEVLDL